MTEYLTLINKPRIFYKSVEKETYLETIKKTIIPTIFFAIVNTITSYYLFWNIYELFKQPRPSLSYSILISLISLPLSVVVLSYLIQLSFKIMKVKAKFDQTLKTQVYPLIFNLALLIIVELVLFITPILMARFIIYFLVTMAMGIWVASLSIIGLSELHKIKTGKATGAYFLSIGLLLALLIVIGLIFVIFPIK